MVSSPLEHWTSCRSSSLARSFFSGSAWPAMQASTTLMVPDAHLARISGLNEAIRGLASIAAPPLGAVLMALLPMYMVLSVDLITAAIAILALVAVAIPEVRRSEGRIAKSVIADLKDAFHYIRSWKGALWMTIIFMLINFLINPAFALLPLLTLEHFGGGAMEYAALESLAGAGMITGGLALGVWGGTSRKIVTCMAATGMCGLGVGLIGLLPPSGYMGDLRMPAHRLSLPIINGTIVAIMQRACGRTTRAGARHPGLGSGGHDPGGPRSRRPHLRAYRHPGMVPPGGLGDGVHRPGIDVHAGHHAHGGPSTRGRARGNNPVMRAG